MIQLLRQQLNAKGMQEVKETPDLFITCLIGVGAATTGSSLYAPGQQARYDFRIPAGMSGITSSTELTGNVIIEIVDASTNELPLLIEVPPFDPD